jgi:hypothetical protein
MPHPAFASAPSLRHSAAYRPWLGLLGLLIAGILAGCATPRPSPSLRPFQPAQDTFAFTNHTVWEYRLDPTTGRQVHTRNPDRPDFALRCFNMARGVKLFHRHARFDPSQPRLAPQAYRPLIRRVLARSPRGPGPSEPVRIPGFSHLRELSAAQPDEVRAELGGAGQSYLQRGHWRMVLPFTRGQRTREARRLAAKLHEDGPVVIHVVTFPQLTLNHALVLHTATQTPDGWQYEAYDPNTPDRPARLHFGLVEGRFRLEPTPYFLGGRVEVYEVYRNLLY